jgi:hypothetical protein
MCDKALYHMLRGAVMGIEGKWFTSGIQDGLKGAVGAAVGVVVTGAAAVAISALTGGSLVHLMGGLTKDDAFGGIYFEPEGKLPSLVGGNPLNDRKRACDEQNFVKAELVHFQIVEDEYSATRGLMFLCIPKKRR